MIKRPSEGAVLPRNERIKRELEDLRHYVDNFNVHRKIALRDDQTYRELSKDDVQKTEVDNWEFGYKLEEYPTYFVRILYIKPKNCRINEVPYQELRPIIVTAYEACFDKGAGQGDAFVTPAGSLMLTQKFSPIFLVEKNPGLRVPGGTGKP